MADPTTTNKSFTVPDTGADVGTWGAVVNTNITALDDFLGTTSSLALAAGVTTVTAAQAQAYRLALTGTLTGACTITIPAKGGFFAFHDATDRGSSVYSITVTTGSGRTQNLPARHSRIYCDGTNCYLAHEPKHGTTRDFCGAVAPPLWVMCYGQAVSRTTYADLFSAIGTTWGAGDGSTTFNLPDLRGRATFGADAMGGTSASRLTAASLGASAALAAAGGNELIQAHTHTTSDPTHTHTQNAHTHTTSDPTHTHTQNAHTHADAGHTHTSPTHYHETQIYYGAPSLFWGEGTHTSVGAGLVESAGSGGSVDYTESAQAIIESATASLQSTAATNQTATTGITQNAATAVNQTATTGIIAQSNTGGNSQNVPPAAVTNKIIYAGQ